MTRKALPKRTVLVTALAVGLGISGLAFGQATTGAIFGTAPSGDTVQIVGNSGLTRTATVGANGQFSFGELPLGSYTVNLIKDGQTVSTRNNVTIRIGAGVSVNFTGTAAQNAQQLGTVQVTANALPTIDVTTTHNSTIITAEQLRRIPVAHNAMAIALLTPGTMATGSFGSGINIGGSSIAENAYYVNGFNTGAPYRNESFFELPYGAIGQQQTLAGGFGAKYGRSDGGVISQTGKRGTNEWHFGAQIRWQPRVLQSTQKDLYWPYQTLPSQSFCQALQNPDTGAFYCGPGTETFSHQPNYRPGQLRDYNDHDNAWYTTYTGYVGGPLIKDKLFMFVDVAVSRNASENVSGPNGVSTESFSRSHDTKTYAKLDWNINDNNILEFTYLADRGKSGLGTTYNYDLDTNTQGTFRNNQNVGVTDAKFEILKYTSYISDNATLSILYGHSTFHNPVIYSNGSTLPYVNRADEQNPAFWGPDVDPNVGIINTQNKTGMTSPLRSTASHGLRVDFSYQLGNHKLGVGVDDMWYYGNDQGNSYSGGQPPAAVGPFPGLEPVGFRWDYGQKPDGTYYVRYYNYSNAAGMKNKQGAYYFQDNWQVTPNLLAIIGVRNDSYTNYNNAGQAFVTQKNQWSPRIGISWDVFGDSSLKIWGNIGRYYLAIPLNGANRAANVSYYLYQDFTYTGIDSNGLPQGLSPLIPMTSPDGELGVGKDPKQVTSSNLVPSFADQLNFGFDMKLGEHYQYGASVHMRRLGVAIDDECEPDVIANKMKSLGYDPADYTVENPYCRLINPGKTSDIKIQKIGSSDTYITVPVTFADWGYPQKPKRNYDAIDLYFQRNFDGKWQARVDYTYTAAFGNTTGQVRPDFGQQDVSKTEDWDSAALMVGSYGQLLSARRHHLRLRGSYQITSDWLVGGSLDIESGSAQECLGYYGPDAIGDPTGYNGGGGGNYHVCLGRIVQAGSSDPLAGHTPWLHTVNLRVTYSPTFADHRLSASLEVFNALNEQNALTTTASLVSAPHQMSNTFHYPRSYESPRAVVFMISYDY